MSDLAHARAANDHLRAQLAGCEGVVGLGIARVKSGCCLKVNVSAREVVDQVPSSVDGVEVHVSLVGPITSQVRRQPALRTGSESLRPAVGRRGDHGRVGDDRP
ncbi:MAG: hypothetical protein ACYC1Z_12125 [Georgenia sp.]